MTNTTTSRTRTIRLTDAEIQDMLNKAAEKGAETALKHFGVFDEQGAQQLDLDWREIKDFVKLFKSVQVGVGKWLLGIVGGAIVVVLGFAAGIKGGFTGGNQ